MKKAVKSIKFGNKLNFFDRVFLTFSTKVILRKTSKGFVNRLYRGFLSVRNITNFCLPSLVLCDILYLGLGEGKNKTKAV
jgi:hypothetical protein